jgi:polysaccharide chain length determinant protein (PEP-CTERM system associated)
MTQKSSSVPPLSLVRLLWKSKWAILVVWVVISGATIAIVSSIPPVYYAESLILVDSQKIPERFVSSTVSTDVQDRLATINQQILSATRLERIIADFGLYRKEKKVLAPEEIIEKMRKDLTFRVEKGWSGNRPGAFHVGYQGVDPAVVVQVVNRISNLYVEENLRTREVQAEGTSDFINAQLQEAKKTLDDLEAKLSQYKLAHNGELPEQQQSLISALAQLQTSLEANRDAANRAQQNKLMLENTLSMTQTTLDSMERAAQVDSTPPPAPPKARRQSEILQQQYDLNRQRYAETYPDMRKLKQEIETAKQVEEQQAAAPVAPEKPTAAAATQRANELQRDLALNQTRERIKQLRTQISFENAEIEDRKNQQQKIMKEMGGYQGRLAHLPIREQEIAQLMRDYEISKTNYRSLHDKKISAEMSTDMERRQKSERFTVLDQARQPDKPTKPNRPLWNALGSGMGLLLGGGVTLLMGLRKDLVLGEWELPRDIVVLGRLPYIEIPPPEGVSLPPRPKRKPFFKRLILPSALLCGLGVVAMTAYFVLQRH